MAITQEYRQTEEYRDAVKRWRHSFSEFWPAELLAEFVELTNFEERLRFFVAHPELGRAS